MVKVARAESGLNLAQAQGSQIISPLEEKPVMWGLAEDAAALVQVALAGHRSFQALL